MSGRSPSSESTATAAPLYEVSRIAELRSVHAAFLYLHNQEMEFRRWQMRLAEVPAPPFGEEARSEWLRQRFVAFGLHHVRVDDVGNVTGLLYEEPQVPLIALSAHLDTVFPVGSPLNMREEGNYLYGPGISDNAAGVVAILAMACALKHARLRLATNVVFLGNVGEEGEGNLRGIRHIFADPYWSSAIKALLVVDGAGADTYVTQALGSKRFEVSFSGPGGHSWSDFGVPNPIVLLARALVRFSEGDVPECPRTTLNIGVIQGGTSVNSIPESASARVDLRSASRDELKKLEDRLHRAVESVWNELAASYRPTDSRAQKVSFGIETIGDRPAAELAPEARILQVIRQVDSHFRIKSVPRLASTDANIPLSLGREAITIGAGGDGGGAHTLREWFDCSGRDLGLKRILLALAALAGVYE
ncbi:MAG TPA: M20/M25/M40 family metallo-hydrolase [Candidatus Angelobacter sp.]|nr:M20/M25/M40 family metallo-hydrolase [Candidatus Angelobacter sp.]